MAKPLFDLRHVPFSRYGSFFAFSMLPASPRQREGLFLRSVHGDTGETGALFRIELLQEGLPAAFLPQAFPTVLRLEGAGGRVEICIPESGKVRLRATGAGVRFAVDSGDFDFDCAVRRGANRWQVTSFSRRIQCMVWPLVGTLRVDAPWRGDRCDRIVLDFLPDDASRVVEGVIEELSGETASSAPHEPVFDECLRGIREEFLGWLQDYSGLPSDLDEARELAAYVLWSSVVPAGGHFARPAMLMSKNWMCQVWSWDHCFNALALAPGHADLSWDQFMLLFDRQRPDGSLPDSISDRLVRWDFVKPPIHGWALRKLMEHPNLVGEHRLRQAYEPLCRWTRWWLHHRDDDADGLPQYNHGNDSGWDNGTLFLGGVPVETPDLAAFLTLQMETLAEVARRLGNGKEAGEWDRERDALLARLLQRFWKDDRFVALRGEEHAIVDSDSLLLLVPLVLGRRLPPTVSAPLVRRLRADFLTPHGLATERPESPWYRSDGYWRGPIWAPSTFLIFDGLRDLGETELALEIARRFCAMASRSGMAENFDALTGQGLRDRAYTWTASVFFLLAGALASRAPFLADQAPQPPAPGDRHAGGARARHQGSGPFP